MDLSLAGLSEEEQVRIATSNSLACQGGPSMAYDLSDAYAAPSTSSKRARQPSPLRSPVPKKRRDLPWDDDSPPDDDGDEKAEDEDLEALLPPESTPHATWQETACEVALAMLESEPAMATRLLDVTMGGEPTTGRSKGPVPSVELWSAFSFLFPFSLLDPVD